MVGPALLATREAHPAAAAATTTAAAATTTATAASSVVATTSRVALPARRASVGVTAERNEERLGRTSHEAVVKGDAVGVVREASARDAAAGPLHAAVTRAGGEPDGQDACPPSLG
jgi:hypothetical protein